MLPKFLNLKNTVVTELDVVVVVFMERIMLKKDTQSKCICVVSTVHEEHKFYVKTNT